MGRVRGGERTKEILGKTEMWEEEEEQNKTRQVRREEKSVLGEEMRRGEREEKEERRGNIKDAVWVGESGERK